MQRVSSERGVDGVTDGVVVKLVILELMNTDERDEINAMQTN